ncbi:MAG: ABC transporter permease subunit, partial [Bacteroidales bacterium]|nr:ABC transporter permease subunit [Bacteroidales bacterium]
HEFKMIRNSVFTWSISISLLLLVFMSLFSSFANDAAILNEAMAQFPPELLMAFGMTGIDMSTVLGFFSFAFLFCQICLAVQASNYGFGLVSLEERDMTADFLLAKPVSRTHILTSKLLAALTGLTITNIVIWISSFVFIELFRDGRAYDTGTLILLLSSIVLFQLFFLTVGILISLLMKKVRSVTPLSMALAFGMYVISAFGGMLGDAKMELITPFKHFEPNYIVTNAAYDMPLVLISVSVIIISIAASYVLYVKRNINSAT